MISREGGEFRGVVGWLASEVQGFSCQLRRQGPEFDGGHRTFGDLACFDAGGVVLVHPARLEQGENSSSCPMLFGIEEHPTDNLQTKWAELFVV